MKEPPERDLFLLKELNEETADELIKDIIRINVYDAEQETKLIAYERSPIRLHMCTPRRTINISVCNMRPNKM